MRIIFFSEAKQHAQNKNASGKLLKHGLAGSQALF